MSPLMPHSTINLNQIIEMCLKGDRMAQERLFYTYSGQMLSICRRYCNDLQEAEDVLQEGFINIFTNLQKFENNGSFEGWMKRIFVNLSIRSWQKRSNSKEINGLDLMPDCSIEPSVISSMSEEQILEIIADLPDGYRTVFNLFAIEGYTHKEIADLLGTQEATSRSQLLKARRLLQDKIAALQKIAV